MTITMTQGHYDLLPSFEFEEVDQLQADMLHPATEVKFKMQIYELQQAYMSIQLVGTPEEVAADMQRMAFIKGKLEVLITLLEDSKEARLKQSITN